MTIIASLLRAAELPDSPTARLDAELLLAAALGKSRSYLHTWPEKIVSSEAALTFAEYLLRRRAGEPVAYILGEKEFMGLMFKVTPDTLVPRPDTEILVQAAVDELKAQTEGNEEPARLVDIGTGSGAVCLSVLSLLDGVTADTVDISPAARAVAEENAAALGLEARVKFHTGDLLAPVAGQQFTAILSNPPYIPVADIAELAPEVRCKEPMTALAGGVDGLDFYRRLCTEAPAMLTENGFMAFEVGIDQAEAVAALAEDNPLIGRTEIRKDYAGIDRVVLAWRK